MPGGQVSSSPGPRLVNVPNALTVLRLVLVPAFVACLVAGTAGWRTAAFIVFAVASITDLLDGELARRSGLITDFGKIADPIADKALTGSALITLSAIGELWWWVTVVIMIREVGVTLLRFWVIRHGVIAASRGGKVKTVLLMVAIGLYVLPIHADLIRASFMGAALVVTVATGGDYVLRALRLRRSRPVGAGAADMARTGSMSAAAETGGAAKTGGEGETGGERETGGEGETGRAADGAAR